MEDVEKELARQLNTAKIRIAKLEAENQRLRELAWRAYHRLHNLEMDATPLEDELLAALKQGEG